MRRGSSLRTAVRCVVTLAGRSPARGWARSRRPKARRRLWSCGAHHCLAHRSRHGQAHPTAVARSNRSPHHVQPPIRPVGVGRHSGPRHDENPSGPGHRGSPCVRTTASSRLRHGTPAPPRLVHRTPPGQKACTRPGGARGCSGVNRQEAGMAAQPGRVQHRRLACTGRRPRSAARHRRSRWLDDAVVATTSGPCQGIRALGSTTIDPRHEPRFRRGSQ